MSTQYYPIDYAKLQGLLRAKGLTPAQASLEMGYTETFLVHYNTMKKIRKGHAMQIKAMFGIEPEQYAPDPEPKEAPKAEQGAGLTISDRVCLERLAKSVEDMRLTVNALMLQVKGVNDAMSKLSELTDKPDFLYKALFVPVFNAIKAAEIENSAANNEVKRRIDGTPINGGRRF